MARKTINLQQILSRNATKAGDYDYKVVKLQNSIEFKCGDIITKDQVEKLCNDEVWTVNIT